MYGAIIFQKEFKRVFEVESYQPPANHIAFLIRKNMESGKIRGILYLEEFEATKNWKKCGKTLLWLATEII